MNENGAAADPVAGVAGDAAVVLLAAAPNPNMGFDSWLATAPFVAPKVGAGAEDVPKPKTGFVVCVSVFCAVFPKGEGAAEVDDPLLPNENADLGASAGFALLDTVPKGDGNGPDVTAPNGDAFVVDWTLLVVPNPKVGFVGSAGFAALLAAAPKGDGTLDVPDSVPNADVVLDPPPNGLGFEAGALGVPKENGDLAVDDEGAAALVEAPPKGFVGTEDTAAGCELPVTPKLNLGVELAGAGVNAGGAEGTAGAGTAAVTGGAGVEEALAGFDVTPKLNFSGPDAAARVGTGSTVLTASTVEAGVSGLAKENGEAAGCDGGGPLPRRDNNEAPVAVFACSEALVESLDALDGFPRGEAVAVFACCAGVIPKEKVVCGAVLAGAGVAPGGAAGLAKKLGMDDVVDVGAVAAAGAVGFAKKLGIEVLATGCGAEVEAVMALEEAAVGGANDKAAAGLDEASKGVEAEGVVLILGNSVILVLLTVAAVPLLTGGKLKVDGAAEVEDLSVTLSEGVAVEGVAKRDVGVVEAGAAGIVLGVAASGDALTPLVVRVDCCLSLIFDMAAASRSCFSHLEYDFVFCSLGLSAAGDAGGW